MYFLTKDNKMTNIQFNYLYRNTGNFKKFGYIVFDNPNNVELHIVVNFIKENFLNGEFFCRRRVAGPITVF